MANVGNKRIILDWLYSYEDFIRFWIHAIATIAIVLIAFYEVDRELTPVVRTVTTTHQLEYLPTTFVLVEGVTNRFTERVAGGISMPQVEMSIEAYRASERRGVTHYVVIGLGRVTTIHYFDIQQNLIVHAATTVSSPTWEPRGILLGGFYEADQASLDDRTLRIRHTFDTTDAVLWSLLAVVFVVLAYLVLARSILNWLVIDRFFTMVLRLRGR